MALSVLMASTWPCWSMTRQSAQSFTFQATTCWAPGWATRLPRESAPPAAQTRLWPRLAGPVMVEPSGHQQLLGCVVVDGGEVDRIRIRAAPGLAFAVDRHGLGHDVHLARRHGLAPIVVGDDLEVDRRGVGAEDGLIDLLEHVDVESLELTGDRVAIGPQIRVLVHPGDEVPPGVDVGHPGAGRHVTGGGHRARGRVAGGAVGGRRRGGHRVDDGRIGGQDGRGVDRRDGAEPAASCCRRPRPGRRRPGPRPDESRQVPVGWWVGSRCITPTGTRRSGVGSPGGRRRRWRSKGRRWPR